MTKLTFKITTQYMEEYNHDAENWSESFYKWKFGNTYIIHGFDQDATAVAFVANELCCNNEFPKHWEKVDIDYKEKEEYWDKEMPRIYIHYWVALLGDKSSYTTNEHINYKHISGDQFLKHVTEADTTIALGNMGGVYKNANIA